MKAIIPHQDTVFLLNNISKEFIELINNENSLQTRLIPNFPVWAIFEDKIYSEVFTESQIKKITFTDIFVEDKNIFYRLKIQYQKNQEIKNVEFKFPFAQIFSDNENTLNLILKTKNFEEKYFPKSEKSLKTGNVILENSCWKLFDEKWHKIK